MDDLQPHSVLALRLTVSSSLGPLGWGERALLEHWAARAVSGPAGKPHLSRGLSEEGEELAGSLGAAASLCVSVALLDAASALWVGASTQATSCLVLDCLWLRPQFRNCVRASPRSSAGGSVSKHRLFVLRAGSQGWWPPGWDTQAWLGL